MIIYIGNSNEVIRKLLEFSNELVKLQDTKSIHRNFLAFFYTNSKRSEKRH